MSDGTSAAPSGGTSAPAGSTAPAPTNGAASPATAHAPGVTSPTTSPKSGEGAVSGTPSPPPAWQPIRTKLKFGDGQEEDVEIPDEDTLKRRLVAAKGFDRANKKALEYERRIAEFLKAADGDEGEFLKAAGKDPDAWFQKRLEKEIARQQMTAEQRQAEDYKAEREKIAAERDSLRAQLQARVHEEQQQREWAAKEPEYRAALQAAGVTHVDDDLVQELAAVAEQFRQAELPWNPRAEVAEAVARRRESKEAWLGSLKPETFLSLGKSALSKLTPEQIHGALPRETVVALVRMEAEAFKRSKSIQPAEPPPPAEPTKEEGPSGYGEREWRKRLAGLR